MLPLIPISLLQSLPFEALLESPFIKALLNLDICKLKCLVGASVFNALHAVRGEVTFQVAIHPLQRATPSTTVKRCRELLETTVICVKRSRVNPSVECLNAHGWGEE